MPQTSKHNYTDKEIVKIAEQLEESEVNDAGIALAKLAPEVAGEVLDHMNAEISAEIISQLATAEAAEILVGMDPDSAVDIIEDLSDKRTEELWEQMPDSDEEQLRDLANYPHDSAGGLMSPAVLALPEHLTVQEAINVIRAEANQKETVYYAFVVEPNRKLVGVLSLRDLILESGNTSIDQLVNISVVSVTPETDAEDVAMIFDRYNYLALPVVDENNYLLGIVTVDDVIDAIREEETEDMHRMVGVSPEERVLSPWYESLKRRQPWLLFNLITAFAAAAIVGIFQDAIAEYTALAVLMPIIAGQGGNAGSQTVTVVVRGMALGGLEPGYGRSVLLKEFILGAFNGVVIGAIVAAIAYGLFGIPELGIVVAIAMLFNLMVAGVMGALIPLGLRYVGADPALASTILLTTITDICGFLFLLGLGTLVLK
jgi:magnesium transporter